jgi:uncharacterized Zn-binding protein involved in type VI secretion
MSVYINGHKVALINQSSAGGGLITGGALDVTIEGKKVALDGDLVASHGIEPHAAAHVIASKNISVTINNKFIVVETDLTTCGDVVVTN